MIYYLLLETVGERLANARKNGMDKATLSRDVREEE